MTAAPPCFLVNRYLEETAQVTIELRKLCSARIIEAVPLAASASAALADGVLIIERPPVSWTAAALTGSW